VLVLESHQSYFQRVNRLSSKYFIVLSFLRKLNVDVHSTRLMLLDRRLGGPQSWPGCGGKEINSHHCSCWELNPGHTAHSLISVLADLPQPQSYKL